MLTQNAFPDTVAPRPVPDAGTSIMQWNVPNVVTMARTLLAVPLGLVAVATSSVPILVLAYLVYWAGDMLDGYTARRLGQETRFGAVFDIVCDRACCAVLACALLVLNPAMLPAIAIFLLQFMALDSMLSLSFLAWDIHSPNYFYQVDRTVFALNWSQPAKTVNTAATVLAIASGNIGLAVLVTLAQLVVKAVSAVRVVSLLRALGARPAPC